jgi:hypothetical protein
MLNVEKFDRQIASLSLAMTEVFGVAIVPLWRDGKYPYARHSDGAFSAPEAISL